MGIIGLFGIEAAQFDFFGSITVITGGKAFISRPAPVGCDFVMVRQTSSSGTTPLSRCVLSQYYLVGLCPLC